MELWTGLLLIMAFIATQDWGKLKYYRRKSAKLFYNSNKAVVYRLIPRDKFNNQPR